MLFFVPRSFVASLLRMTPQGARVSPLVILSLWRRISERKQDSAFSDLSENNLQFSG